MVPAGDRLAGYRESLGVGRLAGNRSAPIAAAVDNCPDRSGDRAWSDGGTAVLRDLFAAFGRAARHPGRAVHGMIDVPVKIRNASAGWTRAVAILDCPIRQ